MLRQSVSLTSPNDKWLKKQVDSEEYSSKSEVVNDLIRKAREIELLREQLVHAKQSGFTSKSKDEIRAEVKAELHRNGKI